MTGAAHLLATPHFEHSVMDLDTPIHYVEVRSDARPLVLVHGIGMDWRVWQGVSRRLAPHFHLLAVDLRGHGDSGKPEHGYSLWHYAADLEDFLAARGLSDVTLVGSSLGGAVCAAVNISPAVVSHRVLVDPPLTLGPILDEEMFRHILKLKHEPLEALETYLSALNPRAGRHAMRTMAEMWHRSSDAVIEELLADRDGYYEPERQMKNIESPTLIMQADPTKGAVLSDSDARKALDLLPDGRLITLAGAGHAVHAFKPVQFVSLIERFASGVPLAP